MAKKPVEREKPDTLSVIARLLAIIAVKGTDKDDAVLQLSGAGLDDRAIAELLTLSESYVRVVRFRRNKKKKRAAKK